MTEILYRRQNGTCKEDAEMKELEKYKVALFMVVRNSSIMEKGITLGKSMKEINKMAHSAVEEIMRTIDFDNAKETYKQGGGTLEEQPTTEPKQDWIPCSEAMPEERDSMFKKFKGTNSWNRAMFERISDEVNVTVEFDDGRRITKTMHTTDKKWRKDSITSGKVIAWMPLPEPYRGDKNE